MTGCILQDVRIAGDFVGMISAASAYERGATTIDILASAWSLGGLTDPDASDEETTRRLNHFVLDCAAHVLAAFAHLIDNAHDTAGTLAAARALTDARPLDGDFEILKKTPRRWTQATKFEAAWSAAHAILASWLDDEAATGHHDAMTLAQLCVLQWTEGRQGSDDRTAGGAGRQADEAAWQAQRLRYWLLSEAPRPLEIASNEAVGFVR